MNALIVVHNFIFNKKKKLSGPTMDVEIVKSKLREHSNLE